VNLKRQVSLNITPFLQMGLSFHIIESEEICSDAASQIILKEE
jgi:hypothetical protein